MNRQIKFRAWDGKKMHYESIQREYDDYYMLNLQGEFWPHTRTGDEWFDYSKDEMNQKQYELMQYTGLKDKDGKEIYEGDIVKCPVTINKHIHGDFTNRVVKWKQDSFTWVFDSPFSWGRFEDNLTGEGSYIKYGEKEVEILIQVIGNIYENPELLK